MVYPSPPSNKSAVRRAGQVIARGLEPLEDVTLLDQWRVSHGYVINTFQAWFKGHFQKVDFNIEFAQRLKRRKTVFDKLRRRLRNGQPVISDVTTMHDFAGCRLIFDSLEELRKFRAHMHSNNVMRNVNHQLRHRPDKFDYISMPKHSGYRGVHDVYRHKPRAHRRGEIGSRNWDGLLVEVQYRTRAQHAWATAVEISDLLDNERAKFGEAGVRRERFFSLASELIARKHENICNAHQHLTLPQIVSEVRALEQELGILRRLNLLRQNDRHEALKRHNVLNIQLVGGGYELQVIAFQSARAAINKANELEGDLLSANAVYVRADNPAQLRSAYRNYFNDPVDFVRLLSPEIDVP